MEENSEKLAKRVANSMKRLAETQAITVIGEATVALLEDENPVTLETLTGFLQEQTKINLSPMIRQRNEAAEAMLRAASSKTP